MPTEKLKKFLDENGVKYVSIKHSPAVTSSEIAESAHIPGKKLAKTVIIEIDGRMAMAVLPSPLHVNFQLLEEATAATRISLAGESDFTEMFPDCEVGAMPPFGNLYNMEVYVAKTLTEDDDIAFNAGSHRELMQMKYSDFEKLVQPKVLRFEMS